MVTASLGDTPCLLLPFVAVWKLIAALATFVGRVIAFGIGLALLAAGVLLTVTVVGAIIGIPLAAMGLLFIARSLF